MRKCDKIALGTVQFGLHYGINNPNGKVKAHEITRILQYAKDHGVDLIDTAKGYGTSESVLGENDLKPFKIVTKISGATDIHSQILDSLSKLKAKTLYGILIHNFELFRKNPTMLLELQFLKEKKIVQKIGFSLNRTTELDYLFDNKIDFDMVQIPYNLFDRRFEVYFEKLNSRGVEIHARSVFLQGLFFLSKESIPSYLKGVTPTLEKLHHLVEKYNLNIASLALNFIIKNDFVDKTVIGVTNLDELKSNIEALRDINFVKNLSSELDCLIVEDENLILPMNWKK